MYKVARIPTYKTFAIFRVGDTPNPYNWVAGPFKTKRLALIALRSWNRESNPSTSIETDWIPVHAIRKLPDGSIQLLTEKGTLSNPSKRKSFMGKVRRLFSKPKGRR